MVTKQQKTSDVMRFTSCKIMELNNKHVGFESFKQNWSLLLRIWRRWKLHLPSGGGLPPKMARSMGCESYVGTMS